MKDFILGALVLVLALPCVFVAVTVIYMLVSMCLSVWLNAFSGDWIPFYQE